REGVIGAISGDVGGEVGEKFIEESDLENLIVSQKLQGGGFILGQVGGERTAGKGTTGQLLNTEQLIRAWIGEPIGQWEGCCDGSSSEGDDCEEKHDEDFDVMWMGMSMNDW
ncbi:MAG: hypothetical protein Q9226_009306, partial [Calogaya cf. arnoldii]